MNASVEVCGCRASLTGQGISKAQGAGRHAHSASKQARKLRHGALAPRFQSSTRPTSGWPQSQRLAPCLAWQSSQRRKAVRPISATADPSPEVIDVTATTAPATNAAERLLGDVEFVKAATGETVPALSLWDSADPSAVALLCFFTHFGDLTTAEYSQLITRKILPFITGVTVAAVGLGSPENAKKFCNLFDFPLDLVYCDPNGDAYRSLGFSPGFAPNTPINPYLKLLPMLAGIGSPGTIQEVLRGYVGDRQRSPVFGGTTPFDVLGSGYQRPFELATQRLFNMSTVLSHWSELAPAREVLLTQQGGTLIFKGSDDVFMHKDSGILMYANVDKVLEVLKSLKL